MHFSKRIGMEAAFGKLDTARRHLQETLNKVFTMYNDNWPMFYGQAGATMAKQIAKWYAEMNKWLSVMWSTYRKDCGDYNTLVPNGLDIDNVARRRTEILPVAVFLKPSREKDLRSYYEVAIHTLFAFVRNTEAFMEHYRDRDPKNNVAYLRCLFRPRGAGRTQLKSAMDKLKLLDPKYIRVIRRNRGENFAHACEEKQQRRHPSARAQNAQDGSHS